MKLRTRFTLLFCCLSLALALCSTAFALRAIGREYLRAESEFGSSGFDLETARDPRLSEAERLESALRALDELRAAASAGKVFHAQAVLEAAWAIALFWAFGVALSALLFGLVARPLTKRLDELTAGTLRVGGDRSFRFPPVGEKEFSPVFASFNAMLDRIAVQEERLAEASRLEGWKEVSSFLFHQLRSPLGGLELAATNIRLAVERAREGAISTAEALALAGTSAERARSESERMRNLLARFKSLSGLSLGPAETVSPRAMVATSVERLPPGRAEVLFSGDEDAVSVDRKLVEEALMNLVMNAVEACPSPPARIHIHARRVEGRVELEIGDENGAVDPRLFARLGTERFSTKPEGTGLGLLFVRRAAALHGGAFAVFPGEDGGFRARIGLPAAATEEGAGP